MPSEPFLRPIRNGAWTAPLDQSKVLSCIGSPWYHEETMHWCLPNFVAHKDAGVEEHHQQYFSTQPIPAWGIAASLGNVTSCRIWGNQFSDQGMLNLKPQRVSHRLQEGVVNVQIGHHSTVGDIISNKYVEVMSKITKKTFTNPCSKPNMFQFRSSTDRLFPLGSCRFVRI